MRYGDIRHGDVFVDDHGRIAKVTQVKAYEDEPSQDYITWYELVPMVGPPYAAPPNAYDTPHQTYHRSFAEIRGMYLAWRKQ